MNLILWLLVVAALVVYVLFPLAVWLKLRINVEGSYRVIDGGELPAKAAVFFKDLTPGMEAIGFEHVGYIWKHAQHLQLDHYHTLWLNRSSGIAALHSALFSSVTLAVKNYSLNFQTELADGVIVETNDVANLGIFVRSHFEHIMQFRQIHDVAMLYKLHLWHERRWASPAVARYLTPAGRELDDLRNSARRTMQLQAAAGRFKEIDGDYVPTLRGAFVMGWKQAPPILQIRLAWTRLGARRLLARAQQESIAPPTAVQLTERHPYDAPPMPQPMDRRWS